MDRAERSNRPRKEVKSVLSSGPASKQFSRSPQGEVGADGAKLSKCSLTVIFSLVSESLSKLPWKVEQKHLFRAKGGGGSAEEHGLMPLSHTRVLTGVNGYRQLAGACQMKVGPRGSQVVDARPAERERHHGLCHSCLLYFNTPDKPTLCAGSLLLLTTEGASQIDSIPRDNTDSSSSNYGYLT